MRTLGHAGTLLLACMMALLACASSVKQAPCAFRGSPDWTKSVAGPRCFRSNEQTSDPLIPAPGQEIILSDVARESPDDRDSFNYFRDDVLVFHRALPRASQGHAIPYGMSWWFKSDGSIALQWTNGYVGGSMCLRETPTGLAGVAEEWSDVGPPWGGAVALIEHPCGPTLRPEE